MSTPIDLAARRRRRHEQRLRGAMSTFTKNGPVPAPGDYLYFVNGNGVAYSSGGSGEIKRVQTTPDGYARIQLLDGTVLSIAPSTVIMWEPKP